MLVLHLMLYVGSRIRFFIVFSRGVYKREKVVLSFDIAAAAAAGGERGRRGETAAAHGHH